MSSIPEIELQPKQKIKSFQEEKLKELLIYLDKYSTFYKKHFAAHGISIATIKKLEDLSAIPPTTKDDLQKGYWEFLCVAPSKIIEYTSTSGTLGKPVIIALTEQDLKRLAYNERISFECAESSSNDLFQLMLTLDRQFMAGIAYYEGIRQLGAGLVRIGPGAPLLQWETIQLLQPTAIVAVPSFILKLTEFAQQHGIVPNQSSVIKAVCIGENIRNTNLELNVLGSKISEAWNIQLFSTYASTEMQTAFIECRYGAGGHHHPELIIVEVLDEQNKVLPPGIPGEITITTLGVEGMPLLRYKTGDIAAYYNEPCLCGRTTIRIGPVIGRKKQMIKLKGTTLYPPAIFDILHGFRNISDYVVEVYTGEYGTDELLLGLQVAEEEKSGLESSLKNIFLSRLRVVPDIRFFSAMEMEIMQKGTGRKALKFLDRRDSLLTS